MGGVRVLPLLGAGILALALLAALGHPVLVPDRGTLVVASPGPPGEGERAVVMVGRIPVVVEARPGARYAFASGALAPVVGHVPRDLSGREVRIPVPAAAWNPWFLVVVGVILVSTAIRREDEGVPWGEAAVLGLILSLTVLALHTGFGGVVWNPYPFPVTLVDGSGARVLEPLSSAAAEGPFLSSRRILGTEWDPFISVALAPLSAALAAILGGLADAAEESLSELAAADLDRSPIVALIATGTVLGSGLLTAAMPAAVILYGYASSTSMMRKIDYVAAAFAPLALRPWGSPFAALAAPATYLAGLGILRLSRAVVNLASARLSR